MKQVLFFDKCFWCLEDFFSYIDGVVETEVGYANGHTANPTYHEVGDGGTGYEEVCKVTFDDSRISLNDLCISFFMKLNPKKVYTEEEKRLRENQSKVIYCDKTDKSIILKAKAEIEQKYGSELLTQVEPLVCYYKAEEEHQHYFKKHPEEAICRI